LDLIEFEILTHISSSPRACPDSETAELHGLHGRDRALAFSVLQETLVRLALAFLWADVQDAVGVPRSRRSEPDFIDPWMESCKDQMAPLP
jgi:hypothetical protein